MLILGAGWPGRGEESVNQIAMMWVHCLSSRHDTGKGTGRQELKLGCDEIYSMESLGQV